MTKCNTVKEIATKIADNGNENDYVRKPIGTDACHIDRSNGETVEESLIRLENMKLKYEDPFLMLLDKDGNELSRTVIVPGNHEHNYTEEITKEATCTKDGIKTYTCGCGDSYSEKIPAIGSHNFVDGVCTVCGELRYEFAPAEIAAHNNWDYTLDDANKTIILNQYTGSEENVIVYENYVIDGVTYKAKFNDDASNMFKDKVNIKTIKFSPNFDTSNVANMKYMFYRCYSLTSLDLSNFNTSNVIDMSYMFHTCSGLTSLNLSNFNTSNVTDMRYMFYNCKLLISLNLENFNTSNLKSMREMFSYCSSLTSLDLSMFDTNNVISMNSMFYSCTSLTSLDLSNFNTSNVIDMNYMFANMSSLTSLDLSSFDTSNVTDMRYMFSNCSSLNSLNLSSFNTSNVIDMGYMFRTCSVLTFLDLRSFIISNSYNTVSMIEMFKDCKNLVTIYVLRDKWIINNADTTDMFLNCGTSEVTYE